MGCMQSNNSNKKNGQKQMIRAGVAQLRQQYNINPKVLGSGSFGKVFQAENKSDNSHKVAIKVISKQKLSQEEIDALHEEVAILQKLDHPNIVKYYETYDDVKFIYLVMELCQGGELFDKITSSPAGMSENEAAKVMDKILRALYHCHVQNIVHRDIKPENIMYGQDGEIKLIDFGLAKQTAKQNTKLHTVAGTPYFIAPEVLQGNYGRECDIWSVGILLYVLITAKYPFDGSGRSEVFQKILKGDFSFPESTIKKVSPECIDLIKKMITVERSKRITCEHAIKHAWFEKCLKRKEGNNQLLDKEVMDRLKKFRGSSTLKKATLNVLVKMLSSKEVEALRQEFQKIDTDNSGIIEIQELEQALKNAKYDMSAQELKQIVQELDYGGDQKINYSEFLAATISVQKFLTHQKLEAIFKQFDVDGTNEISAQNIKDAMSKLGKTITDDEIAEIMKRHDISGDNKISFEEFKNMIMSND